MFKNDINMANRECCDLDIRDYKTKKPWMFADFCNTTTAGFKSDNEYAMKKGAKAIAFANPGEGTMSITFQVAPFRIYSLISDGNVETKAVVPVREIVRCDNVGSLTVKGTPIEGTVYAHHIDTPSDIIEGTFSATSFKATSTEKIKDGEEYVISYLESKVSDESTSVQKISFNNKKNPKDYYITQKTVNKDENGDLVPVLLIAYKATPQKSLDLSFSSTGSPAELTITFDCMEDNKGNVLDMVEIRDIE